ncbi:hypothetical protein [Actinophytocola sp.]|uniref:hypothetical protein n=1 Tax=Actinophytocola sp. TaxID=1872138 RepID=UPI002D7E26D9|nr:hypothetical protein [Actinophytocola sp.]HET9138258.1 hypothetical protein [Actinophytocola sp.]
MTTERPRTGIFATVDGLEYPVNSYPEGGMVQLVVRAAENPDPNLFGWDAGSGVWTATVPTDRCERIVEVTSLANYQGHPCQVIAIDPDGSVGLYYVGAEQAALVRDGFVQIDQGTWARTAAIHEISGYRERHTDLTFDQWKAAAQ